MIRAHAKVGDTDEAVNWFQEMVASELLPDNDSFNLVIGAYVGCAKMNIATQWYGDMISADLKPDAVNSWFPCSCQIALSIAYTCPAGIVQATFGLLINAEICTPDQSLEWFKKMEVIFEPKGSFP